MRRRPSPAFLLVLAICLAGKSASGQVASGNEFSLEQSAIAGGGGELTGGAFVLTGSIGQIEPQSAPATGNGLTVSGGFWASAQQQAPTDMIFSDRFQESQP